MGRGRKKTASATATPVAENPVAGDVVVEEKTDENSVDADSATPVAENPVAGDESTDESMEETPIVESPVVDTSVEKTEEKEQEKTEEKPQGVSAYPVRKKVINNTKGRLIVPFKNIDISSGDSIVVEINNERENNRLESNCFQLSQFNGGTVNIEIV